MRIEDYKPKIIKNDHAVYLEMLIEANKCHTCEKIMLPKIPRGLFPNYRHVNQDAQMKVSGLVYSTYTEVDGRRICEECKNSGKISILCALCNERKPSDKEQESFGYPAEYLCKDCYETVTAKVWEDKCEDLSSSHRYDFE